MKTSSTLKLATPSWVKRQFEAQAKPGHKGNQGDDGIGKTGYQFGFGKVGKASMDTKGGTLRQGAKNDSEPNQSKDQYSKGNYASAKLATTPKSASGEKPKTAGKSFIQKISLAKKGF